MCLLFPLCLRNLLFPWLLMKMLFTIFLQIPLNVIEVMVVLKMLLLALKLVQSGVHHTCGGGHDIVCTLPTLLKLLPNFLKRGELGRTSIFRGGLLGKRGYITFLRGDFYVKNLNLKSEIFNDKNDKNLNWHILTKNLVIFKRWPAVKDEKF